MGENVAEVRKPIDSRWLGRSVPEEELPLLLRDFSGQIDAAWEEVGKKEKEMTDFFNIDQYRMVAEKLPELSVRAQTLALQFCQSSDPEDQREGMKILFHTHLHTILGVVDRFSQLGFPKEELLEQGILTTIGAIRRFQPGGIRLSQYIHQKVTSNSQEALAEYLDVPKTWVREGYLQKIPAWMGEFHHQNGRLPTAEEIARHFFKVREKEVEYQLEEGFLAVRKIEALPETVLEEEEAFKPANQAFIYQEIEENLMRLSPRQRTVLQMRFGLKPYDRDYMLEEVAQRFKVTSEAIRLIQKGALRKLRRLSFTGQLRDLL